MKYANSSTIGDRVAIVRKDAGLSQLEFSQRLSISQSHISNIEKNRKELAASIRKLLCLEFCVNEEWLLTGKGDKYSQAAIDTLELTEASRGIESSDKYGCEKAEAIEMAAWLYHIYPNVASSCSSVEQFLMLFGDSEFCELFNLISVMYQLKVAGSASMFDAVKMLVSQASSLGAVEKLLSNADQHIISHEAQSIARYLKLLVADRKTEDEIFSNGKRQIVGHYIGLKDFFEQMNKK